MKPFAVFVVAMAGDRMVAATTRASDRGEEGRIGLPGGKTVMRASILLISSCPLWQACRCSQARSTILGKSATSSAHILG